MLKKKLSLKFIESFKGYLKKKFGIELEIFEEIPPSPNFGDISFPFPLKISKILKKNPLDLAKEIEEDLKEVFFPNILTSSPPGYLNVFFNREYYINELQNFKEEYPEKKEKIIVEHTNINPNKAAHIGHLRNAILGDTIANFYKHLNYKVEVQNYIDNTGVQVADVVLGLMYIEKKEIEFLEREKKIDHYTWDLYPKITKLIEEKGELLNLRNEILKKIEEGIDPEATYAKKLSSRIMECHLNTMKRLNIKYDVLPKESEILQSKLWEKAFSMLKEKNAVIFEKEGKRKGCWVLVLKGKEDFKGEEDPDKILVRSNGTVTYTGKDIAYQLWKFGLIEGGFNFKEFYKYEDGKFVYESTMEEGKKLEFGKGDIVINVIDVRQSYLQRIVKEALKILGYEKESENSIHFSYEMVNLSEKLAKEMGFDSSKISGRMGIGVKADDFIDLIIKKAKEEVLKRGIEKEEDKVEKISKEIGIGALKIYMLKYGKEKVISFDFDEALNFDGDTGPYLQYGMVRINSLIKKLKEEKKELEVTFPIKDLPDDLWNYLMLCENFNYKLEKAVKNLDPSIFVYYLLDLVKNFHIFYTKNPFLKEEKKDIYNKRLFILYQFQKALKKGLEILNIPIPEKM